MEHTSLNSAQIAATAFLHALGVAWVNRPVKWLALHLFDSSHLHDSPKIRLRVTVQIAASKMRGEIFMVRDTPDDPWVLSKMESYLEHTGTLKQGVKSGSCTKTNQIRTLNISR